MFKFLHCADLHLGSPLTGLPAEAAAVRSEEILSLPARIVELARLRGIKYVFFAGDVFDSPFPPAGVAEYFAECLAAAAELEFYIAPGNHDADVPGSVWRRVSWSPNVRIFTAAEGVARAELDGAVLYGAGAQKKLENGRRLAGFKVLEREKINVMLIHGTVTGRSASSDYAPITAEDMEGSGIDYIALGHGHSFSGLRGAGIAAYCYPGCPEGRGFDETGEKGVVEVTVSGGNGESEAGPSGGADLASVSAGKKIRAEFIPMAQRMFISEKIDVTGLDPIELRRRTEELFEKNRGNLLRLTLTGFAGRLPAASSPYATLPLTLEISDETVPEVDAAALSRENTLEGHTLRLLLAGENSGDASEREKYRRAVRIFLNAIYR